MTATDVPRIPVPAAPMGHDYRCITVDRHAGACGAVIGGVDLADDLADAVIAEIRRALLDHGDLLPWASRSRRSSRSRSAGGSGRTARCRSSKRSPSHPEVIAVVREPTERQGFVFGGIWHSDFSFLPEPPMGSILHAIEVPPFGGDTIWANQYLAFETLSPGLQQTLRGLRGVHSARERVLAEDAGDPRPVRRDEREDERRGQPRAEHPAVRVHAETGREALFLNAQYTIGLDGWWPHESKLLLDYLFAHSTQPAFTCRWRWQRRRRRVLGQPVRAAHGAWPTSRATGA